VDTDITLDEKRVYAGTRDRTVAYVASALGVARVELAGDQIGRFSLVHREAAGSIAGADGRLVVGTGEDVLVATGEEFVPTGFGPTVTVTLADGRPVAVDPDGGVARLVGDEWVSVGSVATPGRADGNLLVAGDGISRVGESVTALPEVPADVRDVAAVESHGGTAAGLYAATGEGLYRLAGETWNPVRDGDFTLVAAAGERVYAARQDGLLARREGEWETLARPVEAPLADLVAGGCLYAVTVDGTVLVHAPAAVAPDGQGGWRWRALGVREVVGLAVP